MNSTSIKMTIISLSLLLNYSAQLNAEEVFATYQGSQHGITVRDTNTLKQKLYRSHNAKANDISLDSSENYYIPSKNHLLKYDSNGALILDITMPKQSTTFTSVAVKEGKVYASHAGSNTGFTIYDALNLKKITTCDTNVSASGIAVDSSLNVYLSAANHILKYSPNCTLLVDMTFPDPAIEYTGVTISQGSQQ